MSLEGETRVQWDAVLEPSSVNKMPPPRVEFLVRAVEVYGDRPAAAWQEDSWNYRSFVHYVARLQWHSGVNKGDTVSFMAANRPEELQRFALWKSPCAAEHRVG